LFWWEQREQREHLERERDDGEVAELFSNHHRHFSEKRGEKPLRSHILSD
jgi:hypothetical protein